MLVIRAGRRINGITRLFERLQRFLDSQEIWLTSLNRLQKSAGLSNIAPQAVVDAAGVDVVYRKGKMGRMNSYWVLVPQ
jgi:hypothetical protein